VLRFVVIVSLGACGASSSSPPARGTPQAPQQRAITHRSSLPAAIQPLLPAHGIYVAGGGLVSSAWRVVIDIDNNTIYGGTARRANAPSFGPMIGSTKDLSQRNEVLLMRLVEDAWREPAPSEPPDPTADYDEIFVVLDGDDTFYLQGFGPIRRPLAAKAIIELRAAAGL